MFKNTYVEKLMKVTEECLWACGKTNQKLTENLNTSPDTQSLTLLCCLVLVYRVISHLSFAKVYFLHARYCADLASSSCFFFYFISFMKLKI